MPAWPRCRGNGAWWHDDHIDLELALVVMIIGIADPELQLPRVVNDMNIKLTRRLSRADTNLVLK